MEDSKVKDTSTAYINALTGLLRNKSDAIGYVLAINGKVNSADIYASHALFTKLWPKLLKSNTVEAIAELNNDAEHQPVTSEVVKTFFVDSEKPTAAAKEVTKRVRVVTREDDKNIFSETQDRQQQGGFIHRNYIRKQ